MRVHVVQAVVIFFAFVCCAVCHARSCTIGWTDSCTHVSPTGSDPSALYDQLETASLACDVQPTSVGGGGWASCPTFNWTSSPDFSLASGSRTGQLQCQNAQGESGGLTSFSISYSCDSAASSSSSSSSSSSTSTCNLGSSFEGIVAGGAQPIGTNMCSSDGCVVAISSTAVQALTMNGTQSIQVGTETGGSCTPGSSSGSVPGIQPGNCVTGANGTFCSEAGQGKNCGTFNGDEVCVGSVSPNSCVKYDSGAVACSVSVSPPVPNNGTAGHAATPTGSIVSTATGATTNYYSNTVVNASTTPVVTNGTGASGVSTSTGSSTSSGSSASSSGDCNANGSNCTGVLPSLDTADSVSSLGQAFVSGVQSSALYTSVSSIGASIPSGSCVTAPISLFGHTYDLAQGSCQIWSTNVAPVLSIIMLAVWSFVGIKIVLGA